MKNHVRIKGLAAVAVMVGILGAGGVAGAAAAEVEEIVGEGTVTLDFGSTPGSVEVDVWTRNLSAVPAYGVAVITDTDGSVYDFGPRLYAPGEEWTYSKTLPGYTCADLGNASGVAFGFADTEDLTDPDWTSGVVTYPDPRITVIGCPVSPDPTGEEPEAPPATSGGSSGTNELPPAKTDGALIAGTASESSPLLGLTVTLAAVLAGATAAGVGALRRR